MSTGIDPDDLAPGAAGASARREHARRRGDRERRTWMLVLDTSALLAVLLDRTPDHALVRRLSADGDLHAPHLIDIEVLHALRGLVRAGRITADRAADARTDFDDLTITRYGHEPLADRIWALRENLSACEAAFVALAEALEVALVTCDARLARAPGVSAEVYPNE